MYLVWVSWCDVWCVVSVSVWMCRDVGVGV